MNDEQIRMAAKEYAAKIQQTDTYRTVCLGVPIETLLRAADREWVFRQSLEFLYNGKKPASRR